MKTTIRLSNLLFEKYPNSANKLTDILDKHKISFEKLENRMTEIAIFEASNGQIQVQPGQDTVCLNQAQIIVFFECDQS